MRFRGDTIVDGQGCTLNFESQAQFLIESNVTLTLKNLIIKNTNNLSAKPFISAINVLGSLALDNCELKLNEDFRFTKGKLFIHNDVKITGTSSFIYVSVDDGLVMPHSRLYFAPDTTLSYFPSSSKNDLLKLSDKSSVLYLDEADLASTTTGCKLTKGRIFCDNHVTFSNTIASRITMGIVRTFSVNYGVNVYDIDWHPSGQFFAVGGTGPNFGGGLGTNHELRVYEVVGSTFVPVDSFDWGANGSNIWSLNWHPTGQYLAVGGEDPSNGDEIQVFEFDGTSLTQLETVNYGDRVRAVKWRSDGNFLAVGGCDPVSGDELQIYSWNGVDLTLVDSVDYGTDGIADIIDVEWNPDGKFVAIGGDDPDAVGGFGTTIDLRIYGFDGSTLTTADGETFGTANASNIFRIAWRPDGDFIAIGGHTPEMFGGAANTSELQIYGWDGSSLSAVTSTDWGNTSSSDIFSLDWSPDSFSLAVGGDESIGSTEFRIYTFDDTTLNLTFSVDYGPDFEADVWAAKWKPDGEQILIGGETAAIDEEVQLYEVVFAGEQHPEVNIITLGDKSKGSDFDVDLKLLGAATLDMHGILNYNSTK